MSHENLDCIIVFWFLLFWFLVCFFTKTNSTTQPWFPIFQPGHHTIRRNWLQIHISKCQGYEGCERPKSCFSGAPPLKVIFSQWALSKGPQINPFCKDFLFSSISEKARFCFLCYILSMEKDLNKEMQTPWALNFEEAILALESQNEGLSEEEAQKRLAKYGKNVFENKKRDKAIKIFLKQFLSPLIFILLGAGALTGILKEWVDMSVILFAVFINVILGFYHEYNAENTLEKLTTYIKDRVRVLRDGKEEEIDSSLVVPGDIISLSYGSRVPADCRIISLNNFRTDEAVLTGESVPVLKHNEILALDKEIPERKNIAFAGTMVVEGYAKALVYATGNNTEIGKIAGIVSSIDKEKTPLQKGMDHIAWLIFGLVLFVIVGIFILGIIRGEEVLPMLLLSSAVAVGAVPEALPIVLTVILAIGATHIAKKKGVVKKLSSAETLASTTLIMTDKTGTLTEAKMKLVGIFTKEEILNGNFEQKTEKEEKHFNHNQKKLLENSLHNIDVVAEEEGGEYVFKGRPLEVNIAKASLHHQIAIDEILEHKGMMVLPFNSTNKFSVVLKDEVYYIMGAPDVLLKKAFVSKEEYLKVEEFINELSESGKRLLGVATLDKKHKGDFKIEDIENINFLGTLAFYDPIRKEVPEAIKNIESHGIKMVLITGDLPGTALSISREIGWEVKEDQIMIGVELRNLKDEELLKLISKIKIFARVTPEDKLRVGKLYQALGEVVAMTGDGVNDAPALKAVDMGISLGSGSDVAKSASDLVLLDDNFETISLAIDEAKKILANIRKTFVYLMSNAWDQVFVVGGSLLLGIPMPLTALQIIWVNLFTGSLPALSFAYEEHQDREIQKGKDMKLVFTKRVRVFTFGIGILSSFLLFLLYYFLLRFGVELEVARAVLFVCFSSYVLAVAYSFRSLKRPIWTYNPFSNKRLNISILIALLLLIITMTVPFVRNIFTLSAMPFVWVFFVLLWVLFNVFMIECAKLLMNLKVFSKTKN